MPSIHTLMSVKCGALDLVVGQENVMLLIMGSISTPIANAPAYFQLEQCVLPTVHLTGTFQAPT